MIGKLKKWGLLYIPTGDFVYQRKDSDNLFIFLTKEMAKLATGEEDNNKIIIATVRKKEKPDYSTWVKYMDTRISKSGDTDLRVSTMFNMDIEELIITHKSSYTCLPEEFEIVEIFNEKT